ncbi:MAG: hypothetical protein H6577_22270 [Lewinellaceae bacterium]|nr:hypothetical protein [Saprospiraceae bacterium]MCB9340861.1 hypothetical protein [Lewinellaceae bacterium]
MQLKNYFLCFSFLSVTVCAASAQSLASADDNTLHFTSVESSPGNAENWTFYLDSESQVYYIDFETISVNLNDILVKDNSGTVVKRDELWNLPVNTIYELDLKDLKPGKYEIELRTYTGVIRKDLTVSE